MPIEFEVVSTHGVDLRDRLAYWEEYNARSLVGLRVSAYRDEGLQARMRRLDLGATRVVELNTNEHVVDRSKGLLTDTPKESVFISHMLAGTSFFMHSGGTLRLRPGDTLIYDTTKPYLFGFDSPMHHVLLDIPFELIDSKKRRALPYVAVGGEHGLGQQAGVLGDLMRSLIGSCAPTARLNGHPATNGIDATLQSERLLSAAEPVLYDNAQSTAALRRAITDYIADNVSCSSLTVEMVARHVGVSVRHVNRLFKPDGTTVGALIRKARLDHAYADLLSAPGLRISDIAARWGFSSQAHFARAFRAHFGHSPTEAREMAITASGPQPLRTTSGRGLRLEPGSEGVE